MASTIIASVITGGGNSHQTVAEELNTYATDFVTQGVVGAITAGPPQTGSFGLTQDASPDMGVTVLAGQAYVAGTPSGQDAQVLRARMTANYTSYTISSNSTGTTKYDWIYLQLNAANASNPDSAADNVINLYTSRSSSNSSDNGSPPTYGLLLGIVTVANGASSIVNANISDQRVNTSIGAQGGSLIVTPSSVGQDAIIQAAGAATNINLDINAKGSGFIKGTPPVWQYLGYAQATGNFTTSSGTAVAITGLTTQVTIPTGATAVKITVWANGMLLSTNTTSGNICIYSGATSAALTTLLTFQTAQPYTTSASIPVICSAVLKSPSAGSIYYTAAAYTGNASDQLQVNGASTAPMYILVECC